MKLKMINCLGTCGPLDGEEVDEREGRKSIPSPCSAHSTENREEYLLRAWLGRDEPRDQVNRGVEGGRRRKPRRDLNKQILRKR